ncbi:MAG: hypothetical protein M3N08_07520 [Pseudomonadota bacterium]|nr:hypothetical protein [Pseudomonadota bacterium]
MTHPKTGLFSALDGPGEDAAGKVLVSAQNIEIENADKLTLRYWNYLRDYLEKQSGTPGLNTCNTLYFDTPDFDLLQSGLKPGMPLADSQGSGLTLRDRLGGRSTDGDVFEDQFSVKRIHADYSKLASNLTRRQYPGQEIKQEYLPYVRMEDEFAHRHSRHVSEYRYGDFPAEIQSMIADRLGTRAKNMVYKPQLVTFVPRSRYQVFLNPHDAYNFILPAKFKEEKRPPLNDYVCIEVAMDKCTHKRPPPGMNIADILTSDRKTPGFKFLRLDLLAEREFKGDRSGPQLTDKTLVATYARFAMFLYDLAQPFASDPKDGPPIRPVMSKLTLGMETLLESAAMGRATELSRLAP